MPAFAGAAVLALAAALYWLGLRSRGGWRAVNDARRNLNPNLAWSDLAPLEKGWFYGAPLFGAAALGLFIMGVAVLVTAGA